MPSEEEVTYKRQIEDKIAWIKDQYKLKFGKEPNGDDMLAGSWRALRGRKERFFSNIFDLPEKDLVYANDLLEKEFYAEQAVQGQSNEPVASVSGVANRGRAQVAFTEKQEPKPATKAQGKAK